MIKLLHKYKKTFVVCIKIGVSVLLFYFVSTKISFNQVWLLIQKSNLLLVFISMFLLLISQVVSSYRLNILFKSTGYHLSQKSNLILYFIGMFYNFFIPGGIGGDAYKVYRLNKAFGWKVKKLSGAMFVDRFSGLTAIAVLISILLYPVASKLLTVSGWGVVLGLIFVIVVILSISYFFVDRFFTVYKPKFYKTIGYSLIVQVFQLAAVYCLMMSFNFSSDIIVYLLMFLISVVLSIVSFAGIGVREYVFYKAADLLHYSKDTAVAIGLLFTFITALISLIGVFFQFKKVTLK